MSAPSIGESLGAGTDFLKKNTVPAIVGFLLAYIVGGVTGGILSGVMYVGYFEMVKKHRAGQSPEIGDVFGGFQKLVPALLAGILGGIIVGIGMALCLIPGLILAPVAALALYYVANGEEDGVNALKRGWATAKENLVGGALVVFVCALVGSLGAIACGVGVLVTFPIALAGIYHYCDGVAGGAGVAETGASKTEGDVAPGAGDEAKDDGGGEGDAPKDG